MFGISSKENPLHIEDVRLVKQEVTPVTTDMDDDAVAEYLDSLIDEGKQPFEGMRVWIHTHPGMSATPSGTDEDTFESVFGACDWAAMIIIGSSGYFCRVQFKILGAKYTAETTDVGVVYPYPESLDEEFKDKVSTPKKVVCNTSKTGVSNAYKGGEGWWGCNWWEEEKCSVCDKTTNGDTIIYCDMCGQVFCHECCGKEATCCHCGGTLIQESLYVED